jgi:hypothetical protein
MLNILVAHKPEAAGIIQGFNLRRDKNFPKHSIFLGDGIRLCITGSGFQRAYSATNFIYSSLKISHPEERLEWINFGSAGSGVFEIGTIVIADSVVHSATDKKWNMKQYFPNNELLCCIFSVDKPQEDYSLPVVYEMEAAGMMSALEEFDQCDRVVVVKVISDGPGHAINSLTIESIQAVLSHSCKEILTIISDYKNLSESPNALI